MHTKELAVMTFLLCIAVGSVVSTSGADAYEDGIISGAGDPDLFQLLSYVDGSGYGIAP